MTTSAILCFGEVLWDMFPSGPRLGGTSANFACHATLLGGRAVVVSAVGDDALGREAVSILRDFGVDTSLVQRVNDTPTGVVEVSVDAAGKPVFSIQADSAWDRISWTPELAARLDDADAIYFGTLSQRGAISRKTIRQALDCARAKGLRRMLDVNLRRPYFDAALIRESIASASALKLSDDELGEVASACGIDASGGWEAVLPELLARFELDVVALTRGADGAVLASRNETVVQPGIPTQVRDTVGAGDAFTAALMVGLLRGDPLQKIAHDGCKVASAVCAQDGAVPEPSSRK